MPGARKDVPKPRKCGCRGPGQEGPAAQRAARTLVWPQPSEGRVGREGETGGPGLTGRPSLSFQAHQEGSSGFWVQEPYSWKVMVAWIRVAAVGKRGTELGHIMNE